MNKKTPFVLIALLVLTSCKSWNTMYEEQQELFRNNRQTFDLAAKLLNASPVYDTTLSIRDKHLQLPDTLVRRLRDVGIANVTLYRQNCRTKEIRFIPDSLWHFKEFSVMEINYNQCDERSRKGYHWTMEGSQHKHSFGQGNGWFIYSDSDRDPF